MIDSIWAGLNSEDFELVTTYEKSRYCKPNLCYYKDKLRKLDVTPKECLINNNEKDISNYNRGNFNELLKFIENLKENAL